MVKKLKDILFYLLAIIIAVMIVRRCVCDSGQRHTSKEKIVIDTIFVAAKKDTGYVPREVKHTELKYIPRYITDTVEISEVIFKDVDTARILRDYYAARFYSDTQKIDYGRIIINDRLSRNRIISRRLIVEQNIPVVEKIITMKEKKRNVVYAGLSFVGNTDRPVYALGADVGIKLKNEKYFGIGIKTTHDNLVYYEAQFKVPIRLKK